MITVLIARLKLRQNEKLHNFSLLSLWHEMDGIHVYCSRMGILISRTGLRSPRRNLGIHKNVTLH